MTKIKKVKDDWGEPVIYVQECSKFSYEFQEDMPKLNQKHMQDYIKRENAKKLKKYVIISIGELYLCEIIAGKRYRILWRESIYILILHYSQEVARPLQYKWRR